MRPIFWMAQAPLAYNRTTIPTSFGMFSVRYTAEALRDIRKSEEVYGGVQEGGGRCQPAANHLLTWPHVSHGYLGISKISGWFRKKETHLRIFHNMARSKKRNWNTNGQNMIEMRLSKWHDQNEVDMIWFKKADEMPSPAHTKTCSKPSGI